MFCDWVQEYATCIPDSQRCLVHNGLLRSSEGLFPWFFLDGSNGTLHGNKTDTLHLPQRRMQRSMMKRMSKKHAKRKATTMKQGRAFVYGSKTKTHESTCLPPWLPNHGAQPARLTNHPRHLVAQLHKTESTCVKPAGEALTSAQDLSKHSRMPRHPFLRRT